MWVELDGSLPQQYESPSLEICSVLEAIAFASFQGRHALYGSRLTLQWMLNQSLSGPAKAAIGRVLSTLAERGAIGDSLSSKIVVQSGNDGVVRDADGHWRASIESLVGLSFESGELLTENLRDAAALRIAALHFRARSDRRGFSFNLRPHNGGGAEILHCFNEAIRARQRFTLSVTDSDQDHPEATSGASSRGCAEAANRSTWIAKHHELPCREIENLLPLNLVSDAVELATSDHQVLNRLGALKQLVQKRPEVIRYTDLKVGVCGRTCSSDERQLSRRTYWKGILSDCEGTTICDDTCQTNPCTCTIVSGISQNVLQHFLDCCSILSIPKQIERAKNSPQWEEWQAVGRIVFDWSLADAPIRS